MRRFHLTSTAILLTATDGILADRDEKSLNRQLLIHDEYRYKVEWPECSFDNFTADECRTLINSELSHNVLGNIRVIVKSEASRIFPNQVELIVNDQDLVVGHNFAGQVEYPFLWNEHQIGPWDCLGKTFDVCCGEIHKEAGVNIRGIHIGCHKTVLQTILNVDPEDDVVWYRNYIYDSEENQMKLTFVEPPKYLNLVIYVGQNGKVSETPKIENVIVEQTTMQDEATDLIGSWITGGTRITDNTPPIAAQTVLMSLPQVQSVNPVLETLGTAGFVIMVLSLTFCCCGLWYMCCVPIKDEEYRLDAIQALNEQPTVTNEKSLSDSDSSINTRV